MTNDESLADERLRGSTANRARHELRLTQPSANETSAERRRQSIVIAATFTADPIQAPMTFWVETLEIAGDVAIAPYAQVLQAILNPESLFNQNPGGFNVLLLRLEDWMRDRPAAEIEQNLEHLRDAVADLIAAVASLRTRSSATTFVFLCPLQSTLPAAYRAGLAELQSTSRQQAARACRCALLDALRPRPAVPRLGH